MLRDDALSNTVGSASESAICDSISFFSVLTLIFIYFPSYIINIAFFSISHVYETNIGLSCLL